MRYFLLILALCLPLALAGATKKPVKKKSASHAVASRTSTSRGRRTARGVKGKSGAGHAQSAAVEHAQAAPTADRYREIQGALAAKGYLKSEPTGTWDPDTQEAMRRFQADQKLEETGKINSLSLISLGLGPKH